MLQNEAQTHLKRLQVLGTLWWYTRLLLKILPATCLSKNEIGRKIVDSTLLSVKLLPFCDNKTYALGMEDNLFTTTKQGDGRNKGVECCCGWNCKSKEMMSITCCTKEYHFLECTKLRRRLGNLQKVVQLEE